VTGGTPTYRPRSGLGLVTLVVPDYDEALAFYVDVLGFELREDTVLSPTERWVVVAPPDNDGAALLLARADGERQRARIGDQTGGRVALFWSVTDFGAAYARLRGAGVEFVRPPHDEPYGTVAVFTDPFGNRWDLIQHHE
jgi:catechol 2,3-dioxygenase-like lactoylglutathione lyase family enzyme